MQDNWIQQIRNGDNAPLKDLFIENNAYCISRLTNQMNCEKEAAKDIFVDALLDLRDTIIKNKQTEIKEIKSYLYGICRNKCLKQFSGKSKFYSKIADIERYYYEEEEEFDQIVKEEIAQEAKDKQQQKLTAIQQSLNLLSDNCKEILKLFYIYKKSMKEIAAALNLADANVAKTTKSRCYKKWRQNITIS